MVLPPNWITSCSLFSEILELLDLNFHFITMMSLYILFRYLYWQLKMYEFHAQLHLRLSLSALRNAFAWTSALVVIIL